MRNVRPEFAAERIEVLPVSVALPGSTESVGILIRDQEYKPIADAEVTLRVKEPGGQERSLPAALADPGDGRIPSDHRHAALVVILEDRHRPRPAVQAQAVRDELTLLHRDLADARQRHPMTRRIVLEDS